MAASLNFFNSSSPNITQAAQLSSDVVIIYIIVAFTAAFGFTINLMAIIMILIQDKVKTASDSIVLHLLFCDLIAAIIMVIHSVVVLVNNSTGLSYQFMDTMCKSLASVAPMSYVLAVSTLALMSVEQYRTIIHPMKPRISGKKVFKILLPIWIVSIAAAIACISETRADPTNTSFCLFYGDDKRSFVLIIAMIYFVFVGYIIPVIIMLYCYVKIIAQLKLLSSITESHVNEESNSQAQKKRIIKTLIAVSVIFALTGIPSVIGFSVMTNIAGKTSNLTQSERDIGSILISVEVILLIFATTCTPIIYFVKKTENCSLSCYHKDQVIPNNNRITVSTVSASAS